MRKGFLRKRRLTLRQGVHIGTNYGQVFQQGNQSSILDSENKIDTQSKDKVSRLQLLYWIIGIIVGCLTTIVR